MDSVLKTGPSRFDDPKSNQFAPSSNRLGGGGSHFLNTPPSIVEPRCQVSRRDERSLQADGFSQNFRFSFAMACLAFLQGRLIWFVDRQPVVSL